MNRILSATPIVTALLLAIQPLPMAALRPAMAATPVPTGPFSDASGQWTTTSSAPLDPTNAFFSSLGTNGRSCATCHAASDAWSVTPAALQARFKSSNGVDPVFASLDGTNCPGLKSTTVADKLAASSLLLTKGLIRVPLTPPPQAQFTITAVENPYGCGSLSTVSVYRQVMPATNLGFQTNVMWDGRESLNSASLKAALTQQAGHAVTGHAAAAKAPADATLQSIVNFELSLFSAQLSDAIAGLLNASGNTGGAAALAKQPVATGNPGPGPAFTVFAPWERVTTTSPPAFAQAAIGRGERIFNTRAMTIPASVGLPPPPGPGAPPANGPPQTCGTCHNAPNVGTSINGRLFNTGISGVNRRTPDLPLITLRNKTTGQTIQTTDPGLALTSGQWSDVDRFKVPGLRNLAARAPYFHNGSAAKLEDVVNFYDTRFNMRLSPQDRADLAAFLKAL